MTLDPVRECHLTEMAPPSLAKRKLNIVLPLPPHLAQLPHALRHMHLLKLGVITYALKERHTVPRTLTFPRTQHPMSRRPTHSAGQGLQTLTHGDDQRTLDGRTIDPFPLLILRLQALLRRRLQQVARQHRVLVRTHTLSVERVVAVGCDFRILYNFQLVLLACVEEAGERGWRQVQCLGDEEVKKVLMLDMRCM